MIAFALCSETFKYYTLFVIICKSNAVSIVPLIVAFLEVDSGPI